MDRLVAPEPTWSLLSPVDTTLVFHLVLEAPWPSAVSLVEVVRQFRRCTTVGRIRQWLVHSHDHRRDESATCIVDILCSWELPLDDEEYVIYVTANSYSWVCDHDADV